MSVSVNWNYPTRVLVGPGRISELPKTCQHQGVTNPLIVTDPGIAGLPMFESVLLHFREEGVSFGVFSGIKANPTGDNVAKGVTAFQDGKHDGVVAVGGGSALDVGKSIALVARQECTLWDLEDVGDNWRRASPARIVPVIAVPTTAGTGSEVGRAALITHQQQRRKVIVFHPMMLPVSVILDANLTVGLPAHLTAATGMDAMSHSLEAYCSPVFHPMAEGIAMEGIRLVKSNLEQAVAFGEDIEARQQMLVASMMGATAFQRGLGAMHALAHPLGAVYDAHHGLLNAVLMPYVLAENRSAIEDRIARLARHLDLEFGFEAFMGWLLSFRDRIGIPHSLDGVIQKDDTFARIGGMAVADPSAATNPLPLDAGGYQVLLEKAFSGDLPFIRAF